MGQRVDLPSVSVLQREIQRLNVRGDCGNPHRGCLSLGCQHEREPVPCIRSSAEADFADVYRVEAGLAWLSIHPLGINSNPVESHVSSLRVANSDAVANLVPRPGICCQVVVRRRSGFSASPLYISATSLPNTMRTAGLSHLIGYAAHGLCRAAKRSPGCSPERGRPRL